MKQCIWTTVYGDNGGAYETECGIAVGISVGALWNFCPNCGGKLLIHIGVSEQTALAAIHEWKNSHESVGRPIYGFYEDEIPKYSYEWTNELQFPVTIEDLDALTNMLVESRKEIATLRTALLRATAIPHCEFCGIGYTGAHRCEAAAGEIARLTGPGSPSARLEWLLGELEKIVPDPEPFSAAPPEQRYVARLTAAIAAAEAR